jgi:hypothetical protein
LVGIEVELIENFGAMYNGEHEYGGVITHAGESAGVFHVRAGCAEWRDEQCRKARHSGYVACKVLLGGLSYRFLKLLAV